MVVAKILRWKYKLAVCFLIFFAFYDYANRLAFFTMFVNIGKIKDGEKYLVVMKHISNHKVYCPLLSIRNTSYDYANNTCKPRPVHPDDCYAAYKRYVRGMQKPDCPRNNPYIIYADICKFLDNSKESSDRVRVKVKCNIHLCEGNPIRIGVLQPNYGLLIRPEFWYIARGESTLEYVINKVIAENIRKGLDFCLLKCETKNKRQIKQALSFPPFLKRHSRNVWKKMKHEKKKPNVNIVVLDSVSRQHFYRQLPKSVKTLKGLPNKDHSIYDFELFQSIAPRTFPNMRALFSGIVDVDSDDELHTYGLDSLFGKYSNMGYQTLLQEDSCWFDSWGALITDNKHSNEKLESADQFSKAWQSLQIKLRNLPIDAYGMTHFSCDVFLQYGKTNQFNHPPKVCFNGYHLSEYFLNYTLEYFQAVEKTLFSYPGFSYTHLNTGHEMSGQRIAYIDGVLSRFIEGTSELKNTLTVIISDHGPKTTRFSQEYMTGRYETSHALMFIIMPNSVKHHFSAKQRNALDNNQYRLVSHLDLFHTLMSINSNISDGLFQPISKERYCDDIPMYSFMTCLCNASSEHLKSSDEDVHWLAEYAIGYLNNLITNSLQLDYGYGNCERLIGKRFEKIRKKELNEKETVYTFDIIIEKYRDEEVFEIAVKKTISNNNVTASILRWRRVSVFQHYAKCCDEHVNIELCICRKESYTLSNPARDSSKLLSIKSFDIITQSRFLDSKCLTILYRYRRHVTYTYEITNFCSDRIYNVTLRLSSNSKMSATTTSVDNLLIKPWLIYYMGTIKLSKTFDYSDIIENVTYSYR